MLRIEVHTKILRYIYHLYKIFYSFENFFVSFCPKNMILDAFWRVIIRVQKTKNRSQPTRPVHHNQSFCGLLISKLKDQDCRSSLLQSWSSPVAVFLQSWDWTSKHYWQWPSIVYVPDLPICRTAGISNSQMSLTFVASVTECDLPPLSSAIWSIQWLLVHWSISSTQNFCNWILVECPNILLLNGSFSAKITQIYI